MKDQIYNVVGLDGREYENIEYDLIREWYAARLINENSLVFSPSIGKWKKIIDVFNLAELNAARNLLQQQKVSDHRQSNERENFNDQNFNNQNFNNQNFNNQQFYESPYNFDRPMPPPGQNFYGNQPKSSSGWKIALGVVGAVVVIFGGLISTGAYFAGKIARTQTVVKSSDGERDRFFAELKNYEIPGSEYVDEKSGAKVVLPKNWIMLKPDNPLIMIHNSKESDEELEKDGLSGSTMLATDKLANRILLAEVIHFPNRIDNVRFFNQSLALVEKEISSQSEPGSYKRILETTVPFGGNMAKKIIFERLNTKKNPRMKEFGLTASKTPIKGQLIVMSDDYHAVILQMWTEKDLFDESLADFNFIEKNFSIPKSKMR